MNKKKRGASKASRHSRYYKESIQIFDRFCIIPIQ